MKVLCVFGQHQYGDPARGIGTEYAAFVPALQKLGHEIIHFDSWEKNHFVDYAELNKALLQVVDREQPDVMLTVQRNYEIWLETLQIIQEKRNVATISWTTDDSWKYQEVSRFIGTAYHAMTTTYPYCVEKYHRDRISNVLLTQWAANAEMLRSPLPASECRYAVSFVGAAYGDRQKKVTALKSHGIEVECFGHGWSSGSIKAEDIPGIIRDSIISLNFANAYKGGVNQVKARTFEVPGAGGFLMTEPALGLEDIYKDGQEIVVFSDTEDLAKKIKSILKNSAHRDSIAQAGFYRTQYEHTYDLRMKDLLEFATQSRDRWCKNHPQSVHVSFESALKRHQLNLPLKLLRSLLVSICNLAFGPQKSIQAARRIVFEISWRLFGARTFTASGLPGRLFPYQ
jgi:spore maturation protein CgeB